MLVTHRRMNSILIPWINKDGERIFLIVVVNVWILFSVRYDSLDKEQSYHPRHRYLSANQSLALI